MKILVVGSGAREHAIVSALQSERSHHDVTCLPGNAGIAEDVSCLSGDATNASVVAGVATRLGVDLVVIGPEAPLVAGVADAVRAAGIPVFGPDRAAAALEGSKSFAKRIMEEAGVPTGRAHRVSTILDAETALDDFGAPYVIKADGLAAGKGVIVTSDRDAAVAHASYWLTHGDILIEEFLDGEEVSLFVFSDGHDVLPLTPAQDFKRLLDGDQGPNTGGMGAYSPLPWLAHEFGSIDAFTRECVETIALPVVRQLESAGTPFVGLLYCGLIVTRHGVRVIEFNARFGDPETQVVLPRMVTPLSEILYASAVGDLAGRPAIEFSPDCVVTVVLASENYPGTPVTGRAIEGLDDAASVPGVHIAHAATAREGDKLVTAGGRVLSVVARGDSFTQARQRAYDALTRIRLEGGHYRRDIAAKVKDDA